MIKKICSFILLVCCSCLFLFNAASAQSWQWLNRIGGAGSSINGFPDEIITDMAVDSAGNSYVCGNVYPGASINSIALTAYTSENCFIAKFNCAGQVLWHHVIGGSASGGGAAFATGLTLDKFGNLYVSAFVTPDGTGHINIIDTSYISNYYNSVILKLDTAGNRKWNWIPYADPSSYCAGAGVSIYSIRTDDNGYIYFTGFSYDTCNVFPGNNGANAPFLAKMDSLKNPVWFHNLDVKFPVEYFYINGNRHPRHFYVDGTGSCYFTGYFNDTISVNSIQIVPIGNSDFFCAKFNSSGNYSWHYTTGLVNNGAIGYDIKTDPITNDIWIGAGAGPGIQFGSFIVNNLYGNHPVIGCVRLNQSGNVLGLFHANMQSTSDSPVIDIIDNKVYFGSLFNGKVKIGSDSVTSINSGDIFLAEVDIPTGQVHLSTSLQGTGSEEQPTVLGHDVHGNLYMGGAFDGTLTFNGNNIPSGGGITDAFVAKWGTSSCAPLSVGEIQDASKLSLYPNPAVERLTLNSSHPVYEYEILNLLGESVRHEYLNTRQNKIEVIVKNLPAGIYLFKVIGESATEIVKFIKL